MKQHRKSRHRRSEAGIALLISIFVLLLVSVVAIALLVSSATETALGANYRSSTNVYYSALAGLEEARGRLLTKNPDYFNIANPGFMPPPGTQVPLGDAHYITNPVAGEDVLTVYPDNEFRSEFGATPANVYRAASVSGNNAQGIPGPLFKWVRINAVTETALGLDIDGGGLDPSTPLYYDGNHLNRTSTGNQALEITSLAVLPNGSQKMVQYIVAPTPITLPPLLAALTLSGSSSSGAAFSSPNTNTVFYVSGKDQDCSGGTGPGPAVVAIGVLRNSDVTAVKTGGNGGGGILPASTQSNYTGSGSLLPDVEPIGSLFPLSLQDPSNLDRLAQTIIQNADKVLTPTPPPGPPYLGTAYASDLHAAATAAGMSASNPVTIAINGNLDISNWGGDEYGPGYGLLLVTGTFTYDPDTNWNGIILVIGQGIVNNTQHGGYNAIDGAVFVAKTRGLGPSFDLLSSLGGASVQFDANMQGDGIRYSSCWIQKAAPVANFKVLSFREIAQ